MTDMDRFIAMLDSADIDYAFGAEPGIIVTRTHFQGGDGSDDSYVEIYHQFNDDDGALSCILASANGCPVCEEAEHSGVEIEADDAHLWGDGEKGRLVS